MIASVSGILSFITVPFPTSLSISMIPFSFSIFVLTTSIPTPRPDTFVTLAAVENPGLNIRPKASFSLIASASRSVMMPFSIDLALSISASKPLPSSTISTTIWLPSL